MQGVDELKRKISTPLLICTIWALASVKCQSDTGYNYPRPTTPPPFTGYNYPKPSKPFNEGYTYTTPKCPLVLPSTSTVTDYQTIVSTAFLTETQTLPPITSTRLETTYVTLPPVVQTQTNTETLSLTFTLTEYSTSITTEIRPTTVTSLLTTTYCQPNTYLPPPTPPPNTYLPVEPPAKEYLSQRIAAISQTGAGFTQTSTSQGSNQGTFISTFVQQQQPGPIKRASVFDSSPTRFGLAPGRPASGERLESNEIIPGGSAPDQLSQPAINIIYLDRNNAASSQGQPPAGLMNWLLCKFNLSSGSCALSVRVNVNMKGPVVIFVATLLAVVGANPMFEGYEYSTPTFTGYDYPKPSCQLQEPCRPETVVQTDYQTVFKTQFVPTTTTRTSTTTLYSREVVPEYVTLPPVTTTRTDYRTRTLTSTTTATSYETETETETQTSTLTKTSTSTRIVPTTVVRTVTSTLPPVTSTKTVTDYRTKTETNFIPTTSYITSTIVEPTTFTQVSTKTERLTSTVTKPLITTVTRTETVPVVTTVTKSCAPSYLPPPPPPCPPNNAYLPPSNDYLPPKNNAPKKDVSYLVSRQNLFQLL
ncbi:mucin-2-like [Anopheles coustani]|uniref:mucin-2-like n=1 Tax=Anopheles coustani TaxID=139045 RepID=UPI00265A8965|nr:mucin-2-like [Anopheles coustani]